MKKIDLGHMIAIIANVGVIAGIVFLAFELRQNNEFMAAQARFNRLSVSTDSWGTWADDPDLSEVRIRASTGEELTDLERRRVEAALMRVFLRLEWIFRELPEDFLASLNHANFAQVCGLEAVDDRIVIVMEFVEGPTLADRIAAGRIGFYPVSTDEALAIAGPV